VDISALVEQALDIFDCELKIVDMEWTHPEGRTAAPPESTSEPLALWDGSVNDLIEYNIGPQAAGLLRNPLTRKPMTFTEVCGLIEKVYGIVIGNPSDRRGTVLDRQDNMAFADDMRKVYQREAEIRNGRPSRR
jgi:hypothetical protein